MDIFVALQILYDSVLAISCAIAFRYGGPSERAGALIFLIGSLASIVVQAQSVFDWRFARSGLLIVDIVTLIAIFALAQRSTRFWPLWATAYHLIAVTTHLVMLVEPQRVLQAYALAQGFWTYPVLLTIVIISLGERRRKLRQTPRPILPTSTAP